jgi:cytochrome b pre-mRNA-processing protein 3
MILKKLFERKPEPEQVLYEAIVAAARQPLFYIEMAVPDTVDGRFDMIALHLFLVLDRLKDDQPEAVRQGLVDVFFRDMDRSLREMGVGDLSVGKKVRKMAEVFYGRVDAYRKAVSEGESALSDAFARNVYAEGGVEQAPKLAHYAWIARAKLDLQSVDSIMKGQLNFS